MTSAKRDIIEDAMAFGFLTIAYFSLNYLLFSGDLSKLGLSYYILVSIVEFIFFFLFVACRSPVYILIIQILSLTLNFLSLLEYSTQSQIIYNLYPYITVCFMSVMGLGLFYELFGRILAAFGRGWGRVANVHDHPIKLSGRGLQ